MHFEKIAFENLYIEFGFKKLFHSTIKWIDLVSKHTKDFFYFVEFKHNISARGSFEVVAEYNV